MNIKQATTSARNFAKNLEAKAQDMRAVDNNPTLDSDPRDNFVSVNSEGWNYQGQFDKQGKTIRFAAATAEKYQADGVEDIPAQSMSIETAENGDKTYRESQLVSHPGCVEYFRENSTQAVISDTGEALAYDTEYYGNSLAFLS